MFFRSSDKDAAPSTPSRPDNNDINLMENPFSPSMPSPRVPEGNLFDVSFETGDIMTTTTPQTTSSDSTADLFDPFGDINTTTTTQSYGNKSQSSSMDFLNTLDSQNDFFSNGGSSTNMFQSPTTSSTNNFFDSATPVYQHQTNGMLTTNNNTSASTNLPYEYHDFDGFGNSPTLADFGPKVDPFADTPDWESVASVASEEIGGPGNGTSGSQNPFAIGSEQMTTNQNMDLFSTKNKSPVAIDPFDNTDPFANGDDPFSTKPTTNQNSDFFGTTNHNADPFGSANQSSVDPFGSANQNSDMFGSANQQSSNIFSSNNATTNSLDMFNNTTPQSSSSTNQNHQNFFSAESSLDPFGTTPTNEVLPTSNPFFSSNDPQHHTTEDSGQDMFSDYLSKVASKDISASSQAVSHNGNSNFTNNSSEFSLSEDFSEMSMNSEAPKTVVSFFIYNILLSKSKDLGYI